MKAPERILNVINDQKNKWKSLGNIFLEYGAIVVCDPLADYDSRNRVQRNVEPGTFPVSVLEQKSKTWGSRYAYAQILFSDDEAKKVIVAKFTSSDSFSVSAGLACFMDILTCNLYIDFVDNFHKKNKKANLYDDFFKAHFSKNADKNSKEGNWINFTIPKTKNNVVMFQSGMGDGTYKAYWVMAKGNRPCRLVIDFNIE